MIPDAIVIVAAVYLAPMGMAAMLYFCEWVIERIVK